MFHFTRRPLAILSAVFALAMFALSLGAGRATGQEKEKGADQVRPELLARKNYLAMAVKLNAPAEALKETKLTKESVEAAVERLIKAQGIEVVKVGHERNDMVLIITLAMKAEGGQVTGTCELNVVVVDENKETGDKKAAMAYDSFTTHQGRSARDVGGQLFKAVSKDVGGFCAAHKKHNPK